MGLFKRKVSTKKTLTFPYSISYNTTNPSKTYDVNSDELQFFLKLSEDIDSKYSSFIELYRIADGALSLYNLSSPFGRIKLQGRKHYLQVYKSIYKTYTVYGELEDFITEIHNLENYIKKYLE